MSEIPGPEVAVKARAPAQPAPMAMPTAASSSSAWMTAAVRLPSGGDAVLLEEFLGVFREAARGGDRIPGQNARPAKEHAQGRGLVALDQDLVAGRLHPLDLERQIGRQVGGGPLEAGPRGVDVDLGGLGLAAGKLAANARLDRLELDLAHRRQDPHIDHVDDLAELVAIRLVGLVLGVGLFHQLLERDREKLDVIAKLAQIHVEIVTIDADRSGLECEGVVRAVCSFMHTRTCGSRT